MVKVILICNAGMSTAMMAKRINENADGYCFVEAYGESEYREHLENCDIILVGPQIRHMIPNIKKNVGEDIPVDFIEPVDYGMMRADAVIAKIKRISLNLTKRYLDNK